jgi:RES domain-containing protein
LIRHWRISNYADLRGLGGLKAAACWDHRGATVVYTSETASGALLEMMVHLEALLRESRKNNQGKRVSR